MSSWSSLQGLLLISTVPTPKHRASPKDADQQSRQRRAWRPHLGMGSRTSQPGGLTPAFKGAALKSKEPTLHKYINLFIERMRTLGGTGQGVNLPTWMNWLCLSISADMASNLETNALKDLKNPPYLELLYRFNNGIVVTQMSRRFPLLSLLKYSFLLSYYYIREHSHRLLEQRIRRKGSALHLDFFEQMIPEDREPPKDRKELRHLAQVAGQLLVAGYEAPAMWFYSTIYYLVVNPTILQTLTEEIRGAFESYDAVTSDAVSPLAYLTACLKETLRLMPNVLTGMPVTRPGAMVDGTFIPMGVVCQSSPFASARSPRNFREPLQYRPERWLPEGHPLYDPQFSDDNRKAFQPFSQGPRMCTGREIAWWQGRLFLAKVLLVFDLEMVPGQDVSMDRALKGWGVYEKPRFHVRFVVAGRKTDS